MLSSFVFFYSLNAIHALNAHVHSFDASWASPEHSEQMHSQISAGVEYICGTQNLRQSDGNFLSEFVLHDDNITISDENSLTRQSGALYSVAFYYRLLFRNHRMHDIAHDDHAHEFSVTQCMDDALRYLSKNSFAIATHDVDAAGQLVGNSTGATALAVLAVVDICVAEQNQANELKQPHLCGAYMPVFKSWVRGLMSMRARKLAFDAQVLKVGAFQKHLSSDSESSDVCEYSVRHDAEAYLAFARLLQFENYLYVHIGHSDELWRDIKTVVTGLDEYYLAFRDLDKLEDDTHWLLQAWFTRWVTLSAQVSQSAENIFLDHFMITQLMRLKWEQKAVQMLLNGDIGGDIGGADEGDGGDNKALCHTFEGGVDVMHAAMFYVQQWQENGPQDDTMKSMQWFSNDLWQTLQRQYAVIASKQLFADKVAFYFDGRFNGAFQSDFHVDRVRIDTTQHCVSVLLKLYSLLYLNTTHSRSYTFNASDISDTFVNDDIDVRELNYDMFVSAVCLVVVILLVNVVFFYWCWYYPRTQMHARSIHGVMNSDTDGLGGGLADIDLDEYDDSEDVIPDHVAA